MERHLLEEDALETHYPDKPTHQEDTSSIHLEDTSSIHLHGKCQKMTDLRRHRTGSRTWRDGRIRRLQQHTITPLTLRHCVDFDLHLLCLADDDPRTGTCLCWPIESRQHTLGGNAVIHNLGVGDNYLAHVRVFSFFRAGRVVHRRRREVLVSRPCASPWHIPTYGDHP